MANINLTSHETSEDVAPYISVAADIVPPKRRRPLAKPQVAEKKAPKPKAEAPAATKTDAVLKS